MTSPLDTPRLSVAEQLAAWQAEDAALDAERFTLTREQAAAIDADPFPAIALQNAYSAWMHDKACRKLGTIIAPPHAEMALARRWDVNWQDYMADAEAELARASESTVPAIGRAA